LSVVHDGLHPPIMNSRRLTSDSSCIRNKPSLQTHLALEYTQTRDGGADIICLSYSHGIPFKVAIEVKKYSPERSISVELIRGFVGANETIKANKLVYVTTSRYTKDAVKYSTTPFLTNLIELKALPDIQRWANEYKQNRVSGLYLPRGIL